MRIRYNVSFLFVTDRHMERPIHVLASNFWTVYASVDDGNTLYTVQLYMSAYLSRLVEGRWRTWISINPVRPALGHL